MDGAVWWERAAYVTAVVIEAAASAVEFKMFDRMARRRRCPVCGEPGFVEGSVRDWSTLDEKMRDRFGMAIPQRCDFCGVVTD